MSTAIIHDDSRFPFALSLVLRTVITVMGSLETFSSCTVDLAFLCHGPAWDIFHLVQFAFLAMCTRMGHSPQQGSPSGPQRQASRLFHAYVVDV
eukprot:1147379-Pelagomonas_calceolata.AAC.4